MANAMITLSEADPGKKLIGRLNLGRSIPKGKHLVANPTASTAVSISGANAGSDVWTVSAIGGAVWVRFSTDGANASAGNDHYVESGQTRDWTVTKDDEVCRVINA